MSRFNDTDREEEIGPGHPPAHGRWEGARKMAIGGRRGQAALRDLIAALDALPEPRLIGSAICFRGEVCAVGALALRRMMLAGRTRRRALKALPQHTAREQAREGHPDGSDMDIDATARFGEREAGLTFTLAWEMAYANDEIAAHDATPEQRWRTVRRWAVRELKETTDGGQSAP